jgi:hypothetical protein
MCAENPRSFLNPQLVILTRKELNFWYVEQRIINAQGSSTHTNQTTLMSEDCIQYNLNNSNDLKHCCDWTILFNVVIDHVTALHLFAAREESPLTHNAVFHKNSFLLQ